MAKYRIKFRDVIALPIVLIGIGLFLIAIKIGSKWTASTLIEAFFKFKPVKLHV